MTRTTILCGVVLVAGLARGENVVRQVDVKEQGDQTEVLVRCGSTPTFTTYKLERPSRVVVDIANARIRDVQSPLPVDTWAVSQVAVQEFQTDDRTVARVMVVLKRECSYDVRASGGDVRIVLVPSAPRPADASAGEVQRERARAQAAIAETGQARSDAERANSAAREALAAAERERGAAQRARAEAQEARQSSEAVRRTAAASERDHKATEDAMRSSQDKQRDAERRLAQAEGALREAQALRAEAESRRAAAEAQAKSAEQGQLEETKGREAEGAGRHAGRQPADKARARSRVQTRANRDLAATPADGKAPRIIDVSYEEDDRAARVTVWLRGRPEWTLLPREGKHAVMELRGVDLDAALERKLDTSEFGGPVRAVSTYRVPGGTRRVRLIADLAGEPHHRVEETADGLTWRFDKPIPASPTAAMPTSWAPTRVGGFQTAAAPLALAGPAARKRERYSGKRIDLDFKDADIHNMLRLLSDVGEVNIVTGEEVKGQVTIRMRNVPWDQALDVILRSNGLGQVREGNLIRVAPQVALQKERDEEIARLKQIEELKPIETRLVPLSYAKAADVSLRATDFLSPRGKINYDERTNQIVARDTADRLDVIERLVRELDTQTPQVTIEARIIEANTNFVRELGVQWGGDIASSQATGNPTGLVFPNEVGVGGSSFTQGQQQSFVPGAANPNFAVNLPAAAAEGRGGSVGLHMGSVSGTFNLNLRLSAFEDTDQIRILSAPKVTTLDNHKATITSGVSIPFATVSAQGTQTVLTDAVLGLTVTPHVTADASVVLTLDITKSEPGAPTPQGQLTITKKTAQTEMLVKDGDTAVIGGIYTRTTGIVRNKVPWLAELPILGFFFRHTSERDNRSEVLVFVTPRIVNRSVALGR